MKIEKTDLEYTEADAVVLDTFLASSREDKTRWAQRVWDCCRRTSEGEVISRVYQCHSDQTWQERAQELWENKKAGRREAFKFIFGLAEVTDESIVAFKSNPQYKTADEREAASIAAFKS